MINEKKRSIKNILVYHNSKNLFRAERIHKDIHVDNTYVIVASGMTVWVTLDTGLGAGSNVQRVAVAGVKSEGCEGGVRGAALGSLLYTRTGRTRDDRD